MKQKEVEITTLNAYLEYVAEMRKSALVEDEIFTRWFFRGHKNWKWPVKPSAFRGDALLEETNMIRSAQRKNPADFRECSSSFEILTKVQHYGLATRLLDVTINPLVALYFACEPCLEYNLEKNGYYHMEELAGCVYLKNSYWFSPYDPEIQIASAIPFIDIDPNMKLADFCEVLEDYKAIDHKKKEMLLGDKCQSLIQDLQKTYFVVPNNSNERLVKQSGAFILPSALNLDLDNSNNICIVSKATCDLREEFDDEVILIPADCKKEILRELDFLNVNEAILFPELEHQMNYLKRTIPKPMGRVPDFSVFESPKPKTEEKTLVNEEQIAIGPTQRKSIAAVVSSIYKELSNDQQREIDKIISDTLEFPDWYKRPPILALLRLNLIKVFPVTEYERSKYLAAQLVDELQNMYINN